MSKIVDPRFKFVPAEDEMVDSEFELIANPKVSIQVSGGMFAVNENSHTMAEMEAPDYDYDGYWQQDHGTFITFAEAAEVAVKVGV